MPTTERFDTGIIIQRNARSSQDKGKGMHQARTGPSPSAGCRSSVSGSAPFTHKNRIRRTVGKIGEVDLTVVIKRPAKSTSIALLSRKRKLITLGRLPDPKVGNVVRCGQFIQGRTMVGKLHGFRLDVRGADE